MSNGNLAHWRLRGTPEPFLVDAMFWARLGGGDHPAHHRGELPYMGRRSRSEGPVKA